MQEDIKAVHHRSQHRTRGNRMLQVLWTYVVATVLLVFACVCVLASWRMYGRMARASDGESAAQDQLTMMQSQQGEVESDVARLSTPTGVEGELRHRYGVAKPGEGEIQIVQPSASASTSPQTAAEGLFSRLWHVFFP